MGHLEAFEGVFCWHIIVHAVNYKAIGGHTGWPCFIMAAIDTLV